MSGGKPEGRHPICLPLVEVDIRKTGSLTPKRLTAASNTLSQDRKRGPGWHERPEVPRAGIARSIHTAQDRSRADAAQPSKTPRSGHFASDSISDDLGEVPKLSRYSLGLDQRPPAARAPVPEHRHRSGCTRTEPGTVLFRVYGVPMHETRAAMVVRCLGGASEMWSARRIGAAISIRRSIGLTRRPAPQWR